MSVPHQQSINKGTPVTLGLVLTILVTAGAPVMWMARGEQRLMSRFEIQDLKIENVAAEVARTRQAAEVEFLRLREQTGDRLTRTQFINWLELFRLANEKHQLHLPEPPK